MIYLNIALLAYMIIGTWYVYKIKDKNNLTWLWIFAMTLLLSALWPITAIVYSTQLVLKNKS